MKSALLLCCLILTGCCTRQHFPSEPPPFPAAPELLMKQPEALKKLSKPESK